MTNAELIAELQKHPPDAIIMSLDSSGEGMSEIIRVMVGIANDIDDDCLGTFDFYNLDDPEFPPAAPRINAINLVKEHD